MRMRGASRMLGGARGDGSAAANRWGVSWRRGETFRQYARESTEACLLAGEDPNKCYGNKPKWMRNVAAGVAGLMNPAAGLALGVRNMDSAAKAAERQQRHYETIMGRAHKTEQNFVQNETLMNPAIGLRSPLMRDERSSVGPIMTNRVEPVAAPALSPGVVALGFGALLLVGMLKR